MKLKLILVIFFLLLSGQPTLQYCQVFFLFINWAIFSSCLWIHLQRSLFSNSPNCALNHLSSPLKHSSETLFLFWGVFSLHIFHMLSLEGTTYQYVILLLDFMSWPQPNTSELFRKKHSVALRALHSHGSHRDSSPTSVLSLHKTAFHASQAESLLPTRSAFTTWC